jgi:hypothetical protein
MNIKEKILEIALRFMESVEMSEYLRKNAKKLRLIYILELIVYSRSDINDKLTALKSALALTKESKTNFDEWDGNFLNEIKEAIPIIEFAINEINNNIPAGTVFLFTAFHLNEWQETIPFTSFEAAKNHMLTHAEEYDYSDEAGLVHGIIEKWFPSPDGGLQNTLSWHISGDGIIWFFDINEEFDKKLADLADSFSGYGLRELTGLPVPFKPGDIVTIDCRPTLPLNYGVISDIGDNRDCCAVQAVHIDENGKLKASALKHDLHNLPMFTCMLRLQSFNGELPEEFKPLKAVSEYIKCNPQIQLGLLRLESNKQIGTQSDLYKLFKKRKTSVSLSSVWIETLIFLVPRHFSQCYFQCVIQ